VPAILLTTAVVALVAYGYLSLIGLAAGWFLLPRRWLPYWPLVVPVLGWVVLDAVAHPLNIVFPLRPVLWAIGVVAALVVAGVAFRNGRTVLAVARRWGPWREALVPLVLGLGVYASGMWAHVRQGALSHVIFDSDAERYAEVIASMLSFPVGWRLALVVNFADTPQGPPYWHMHALVSALTGLDVFTAAMPSHMLMLSLAPSGVFLFCRTVLKAAWGVASLAALLFALSGLPIIIASFGFTHQTSSIALAPFGFTALMLLVTSGAWRTLATAGLVTAMAIVSNYPATGPLFFAAIGGLGLLLLARPLLDGRRRITLPHIGSVAGRLAGLALFTLLAGAASHSLFVAYLLRTMGTAVIRSIDISSRAMHVGTFVSPLAAMGTVPWDLYREVRFAEDGLPLALSWPTDGDWRTLIPAVAGAVLVAVGLASALQRRTRYPLMVVLLAVAAALLAFRVGAKWPYGEFKVAAPVWFLVPSLAAAGARALQRVWRVGAVPAVALTLCFGTGVAATHWHAHRLLALPWGAAIAEREVAGARAVVHAIPPGASVYVSGRLTPPEMRDWKGVPLRHARGAISAATAVSYVRWRWGGLITEMLLYGGRPAYGFVPRDSIPLKAPLHGATTDYVLLDDTDDPRLYGLLPGDLAHGAGSLRLYRNAGRPSLFGLITTPEELRLHVTSDGITTEAATAPPFDAFHTGRRGSGDPPAVALPAYDLPGGGLPHPFPAPPPKAVSQPSRRGSLLIGLHALVDVPFDIVLRGATGEERLRRIVVPAGLTWYTTEQVAWPATLTLRPAHGEGSALIRPIGVIQLDTVDSPPAESLERSDAGSLWPLITLAARVDAPGDGALSLEAWFSYSGSREHHWQTQLRGGQELWARTTAMETSLHPGPGQRIWRANLRPGESPEQWASDDRTPGSPVAAWRPDGPLSYLWLELGPHPTLLYPEAPLLEVRTGGGGAVAIERVHSAALLLPQIGDPGAPPLSRLEPGTLVKGSSANLFYVDGDRLRWVPDLDTLNRRGIPWRLTVLSDSDLWRRPVALPLT